MTRNSPLFVTISEINATYYFQLQALFDGGVACYQENDGLGLNIFISDSYRSGGAAAALETINYRTDTALASAVGISADLNELFFQLLRNQYNTDVSIAQANEQFRNATAALLAKVQAITTNSNDFTGLRQTLDAMVAQINNNSAIGAIRNAQIIANTQNISVLLDELQNLTVEGRAIVGIQILIQRALNRTLDELGIQLDDLNDYLSSGGVDFGIDVGSPGDFFRGIVKVLGDLKKSLLGNCGVVELKCIFGDVFGFFKELVKQALLIGTMLLIGYCLYKCFTARSKNKRGGLTGLSEDHVREIVHEELAKPTLHPQIPVAYSAAPTPPTMNPMASLITRQPVRTVQVVQPPPPPLPPPPQQAPVYVQMTPTYAQMPPQRAMTNPVQRMMPMQTQMQEQQPPHDPFKPLTIG
jgi:hypothetical protein